MASFCLFSSTFHSSFQCLSFDCLPCDCQRRWKKSELTLTGDVFYSWRIISSDREMNEWESGCERAQEETWQANTISSAHSWQPFYVKEALIVREVGSRLVRRLSTNCQLTVGIRIIKHCSADVTCLSWCFGCVPIVSFFQSSLFVHQEVVQSVFVSEKSCIVSKCFCPCNLTNHQLPHEKLSNEKYHQGKKLKFQST